MLYIGIDAGGSKSRLVARSAGREDLVLEGPAANVQTAGIDGAARVFTGLINEALQLRPGIPLVSVCAGAAGAGRADDRTALEAAWREHLGPAAPPHLRVVHDAVIAIEAAFEGGSGIIIIVGTGSIAFAKAMDGAFHRVGGWGYLLGDEGSGFAIGLDGLRAVAAAIDGGPATRIQPLVAERLGIQTADALIHNVYRKHLHIPDVAPLVIEAAEEGDAAARYIIEDQLRRLAQQVRWLVDRCRDIEPQIALMGGLTRNAPIRDALERNLRTLLPGWVIMDPKHDPVEGAVRLAMQANCRP